MADLDLIMITEVAQDIIKTLGIEHHIIPITEVVMATMHKAIKGMEDTTIMEEVAIGIKLIIESGVSHLRDKIKIGELIEVRVTVGLGQVLGQVQIETELDTLSVESMIILHKNVQ